MIRIEYLSKAIFSDDIKRGNRVLMCFEVKEVVTVWISLIRPMSLKKNKISNKQDIQDL